MTRVYEVAFIYKVLGFGIAVLQRLCQTSIKKNLYYEIKDKVFEESFNGVHVSKKKARVKVYGTDSTKEVRARMIELLYERVDMHKDKFISKIIMSELRSLETDKRGKVQAVYPNHDDQVFAYLHAIRVWYDGEDLAERYGIRKNTIRTDEDIEIEESAIEQSKVMQELDLESANRDTDNDIAQVEEQLAYIEDASKYKLNSDFRNQQIETENESFNMFLSWNSAARKAYADKYHIDTESIQNAGSMITIPDSMFGAVTNDEEDSILNNKEFHGNLYNQFNSLL